MSETKTSEQYEEEFHRYCKVVLKMVVVVALLVIGFAWLVVYTEVWQPHLQRDHEQLQEQQRQFRIVREAEMLVAPPYWTVKRDSGEVCILSTLTGSFDREIEMPVPRKALSALWKDGEFRNGIKGKHIKFHYRKGCNAETATDEWDLVEASIVK